MPFTPYHLGPGLLLGVVLFPFIDLSTVMVACVILDIEPIAVIMFNLPYAVHGFFHTYLAATIVSVLLSVVIWPLRGYLNKIVALFGLHQESSFRHIFPASIIGTYSHVFLDSLLYPEMNPFYPLIGNPFVEFFQFAFVYDACIFLGLLGFGVYIVRILYNQMNPRKTRIKEDVFIK
ncbi:hypothetical protein E4H12_01765 [Candidatus Thorarchaeota archaeon]|nr:hypothetical protein [Candidatus Thorarchaeota archaeon]TFG99711.1 MAG: hypothetical protein E4H12_01765 [Candidatus Thorarchaeota archaeon]